MFRDYYMFLRLVWEREKKKGRVDELVLDKNLDSSHVVDQERTAHEFHTLYTTQTPRYMRYRLYNNKPGAPITNTPR